MIHITAMKKGVKWEGDYIFEETKEFFAMLPYLYTPIEGQLKVVIIEPSIKDARTILDNQRIPASLEIEMFIDANTIGNLELERPALNIQNISNYQVYTQLFATLNKLFDPKAIKEIYYRAGPNLEALKIALQDIIAVCTGDKVTMQDVNKVLLPNRRVYAPDVIKAFIIPKTFKYRWTLANKIIEDIGNDIAYYAMRKYIRTLLVNKNKYLLNETVSARFERDVKEIDAFTIDLAYVIFETFNTPILLPVALSHLERRKLP